MDDDLSALILGIGLRILARIKAFNFVTTGLMIGIWEGFALHQTTSRRPGSLKANATQALRFIFDLFFFRDPYMCLVVLMFLLVTWTITNAIVNSRPRHREISRRRGPKGTPREIIHRLHRLQCAVDGTHPPLVPRARFVQFRSPSARSSSQSDVPHSSVQATVATLTRQHTFPQLDPDLQDSASDSTEPQFSTSCEELPVIVKESTITIEGAFPPLPDAEPANSEPIDESPIQTHRITMIKTIEEHDSPAADPPNSSMPTPHLTPLEDLKVLRVHIPASEIDISVAEPLESIHGMEEEEVEEVVTAVFHAIPAEERPLWQEEEKFLSSRLTLPVEADTSHRTIVNIPMEVTPDTEDILESQLHSPTATVVTLDESVISTSNEDALQKRAEYFRTQAQVEVQKRERLIQKRLQAFARKRIKEAFFLALEAKKSKESALVFHRKAERRYFLANNQRRAPTTLDLHGLRVPEAIRRTEQAIHDVVIIGGGKELRVIVGRGIHSPNSKPVLRPAVRQALEKSGLKPIFDRNPGVLKVAIPPRLNSQVVAPFKLSLEVS